MALLFSLFCSPLSSPILLHFSSAFPLLFLSSVFISSDPAATLFVLPHLLVSHLVALPPCMMPPLHHIFSWSVPSSLPLCLLPCGHPFSAYFFSLFFIFLLPLRCMRHSERHLPYQEGRYFRKALVSFMVCGLPGTSP